VVVASAGNQGARTQQYPAAWSGVVAVAGTDAQDRRATFSNYGSWISVSAPAVDLYSTYPGGFAYGSGTSFAAPLVAGEVALFCAARPTLGCDEAPGVIAQSSVSIDPLNADYTGLLGAGRVNMLNALTTNV
jgi:subtilisin family serine protease